MLQNKVRTTLCWRGVDSNHQFRESRHRCPHVDFSVEAAELVDLVGDWTLTFAAAACDLVHCRSRSGRHDETRAELRPGLYRAMAAPAPSSPGKASMTVAPPAAAAGPLWGAPAVWSVTSSSIKVMTQSSSPNASDASGLLSPRAAGAVALAADQLSGSAPVSSNGRYRKGFGCRPRSSRVHDACRGENGHIRLFANEVLARLRRIKPVTVS